MPGGYAALAKTKLAEDEVPDRGQFLIGIACAEGMHEHRPLVGFYLRGLGQYLHDVHARRVAGATVSTSLVVAASFLRSSVVRANTANGKAALNSAAINRALVMTLFLCYQWKSNGLGR